MPLWIRVKNKTFPTKPRAVGYGMVGTGKPAGIEPRRLGTPTSDLWTPTEALKYVAIVELTPISLRISGLGSSLPGASAFTPRIVGGATNGEPHKENSTSRQRDIWSPYPLRIHRFVRFRRCLCRKIWMKDKSCTIRMKETVQRMASIRMTENSCAISHAR